MEENHLKQKLNHPSLEDFTNPGAGEMGTQSSEALSRDQSGPSLWRRELEGASKELAFWVWQTPQPHGQSG